MSVKWKCSMTGKEFKSLKDLEENRKKDPTAVPPRAPESKAGPVESELTEFARHEEEE